MAEVKVTKPDINRPTAPVSRLDPLFSTFPFGGALFGASPFSLMRRITDEMDRAFAKFAPEGAPPPLWTPALELAVKEGKLLATLELPGCTKDQVKVELTEEALIVSGERTGAKEEKQEGSYRSERTYGQFYRSIPLPKGAVINETKAILNNGVLEITVPVTETKVNTHVVPVVEKEAPVAASA